MKLPNRDKIFVHRARDSELSARSKLKIAVGVYDTRYKTKKITLVAPPWDKKKT